MPSQTWISYSFLLLSIFFAKRRMNYTIYIKNTVTNLGLLALIFAGDDLVNKYATNYLSY